MLKFLCEQATTGNSWIVYGILILVLIAMLVFPMFTQRKKNQQYQEMLNSIRVGDLIKTAGGIIGRITKILDKGEIKTVILETGSKTEKSYMEFDMNMIYCVLKSTKVEEPEETEEKTEEDKKELLPAENKADDSAKENEKSEVAVQPAVETKTSTKKTTAKKPAAKKTTVKKTSTKTTKK